MSNLNCQLNLKQHYSILTLKVEEPLDLVIKLEIDSIEVKSLDFNFILCIKG